MNIKIALISSMALLGAHAFAQDSQEINAFPEDIVKSISPVAFAGNTFSITLKNTCVVVGKLVTENDHQITFDKIGLLCTEKNGVNLTGTRFYINKDKFRNTAKE